MKKLFVLFVAINFIVPLLAQQSVNVYPLHWWVGMKNPDLQLIIHDARVERWPVKMKAYPGVTLKKLSITTNRNYLFVDLTISKSAKPGKIEFYWDDGGHT